MPRYPLRRRRIDEGPGQILGRIPGLLLRTRTRRGCLAFMPVARSFVQCHARGACGQARSHTDSTIARDARCRYASVPTVTAAISIAPTIAPGSAAANRSTGLRLRLKVKRKDGLSRSATAAHVRLAREAGDDTCHHNDSSDAIVGRRPRRCVSFEQVSHQLGESGAHVPTDTLKA